MGLDAIALDLQRTGLLKFRQARQVVRAVRDLWKAALADGKSVTTPLGELVIKTPRSGPRRIVLDPSSDLHLDSK